MNGFLTGVEADRKVDCRNLVVRNRSGAPVEFTPPGERVAVVVPHGQGLLCWMDRAFEKTERWQLFPLLRR